MAEIVDEVRLKKTMARKFASNSLFLIVTSDCEFPCVELKSIPASVFPWNLLSEISTFLKVPPVTN